MLTWHKRKERLFWIDKDETWAAAGLFLGAVEWWESVLPRFLNERIIAKEDYMS